MKLPYNFGCDSFAKARIITEDSSYLNHDKSYKGEWKETISDCKYSMGDVVSFTPKGIPFFISVGELEKIAGGDHMSLNSTIDSTSVSPYSKTLNSKDQKRSRFYNNQCNQTTESSVVNNKFWQKTWKKRTEEEDLLLTAAEKGQVETIRNLLKGKTQDLLDTNSKGLNGFTALHLAVSERHLEVVNLLVEAGADVNVKSDALRTPLHIACEYKDIEMLNALIDSGANVNAKDDYGNTPAHVLAEHGWCEGISVYSKSYPDFTIKNMFGQTPSEIASDVNTRNLIIRLEGKDKEKQEKQHAYKRTVIRNMILHNSRADAVKCLLFKIQNSIKFNGYKNLNTQSTNKPNSLKKRRAKIIEAAEQISKIDVKAIKGSMKREVGLNDFDIIKTLGKGSFGEVYLVRYKPTLKLYAMKVLRKKQFEKLNLMQYAITERNVLCHNSHPFIINIDFAFQTAERLFLILTYCPGYCSFVSCSGDLRNLIEREKQLPEDRAKMYAAEILLALEDLHRKDTMYRDLKPENVVIDEDGHAVLTDFGLAKQEMKDTMMTDSICGTPSYLAPEILARKGKGYNKSVDWYGLGILIYEMLVGRLPFIGRNRDEVYRKIRGGPLNLPIFLSVDAISLITSLMNRNPKKRLGAGRQDIEEIKKHSWFENIDWDMVRQRKLNLPKPQPKSILGGYMSPKIFNDQSNLDNKVEGWDYVNIAAV